MPSVRSLLLATTALLSVASAVPHDHHDHEHLVNRALPSAWYHTDDHPAYRLFRRADVPTDGVVYAAVGTPEWSAGYPPDKPDPNSLPQAWVDALNAAVKAGKIPDIPPSTQLPNQNPTYPDGLDPNGDVVCSATYKCRNDGDLWDAPDGVFGASFDDGPTDASPPLYNLLKENNIVATHFMIGKNILGYPEEFKMAYDDLQSDIALHTWTHPYMTTLSNLELVGEFGWTMQLIHNSTGGRLPKYWRPPYGDSDNRVRAIAKEVFGLTTVIWNQDTEDWSIGSPGGATAEEVDANLKKWLTGPKSPGLIILEHELHNTTVDRFLTAFPLIEQNGWKYMSLARLDGGSVYQNADDSISDVTPASVAIAIAGGSPSETSSGSAPSGTSSSGSSGNASGGSKGNQGTSQTTTSAAPDSSQSGSGAAQENPNSAVPVLASGLVTSFSAVLAAFFLW